MRHAAALRAGLAGHTVGGGGIERPFLRQGEVPPLPDEYRRDGVYCRRGKRLTPGRKAYYEGICRRKREEYIRRNRRRLLAEARNAPGGDKLLGEIKNILKMKR
ncbi:hypothetical protein NXV14_23350 [Bacteroides fragilis]|nr:hypothetical protein [Bacteroides fragilis]